VPFSRQPLTFELVDTFKAFFPDDLCADYLLSQAPQHEAFGDTIMRQWIIEGFDPDAYRAEAEQNKQLRLPSPTYPGFVKAVLYDTDYVKVTRESLGLPLDFNAPVHGVFSSYSDRTTDAVWISMMVRPDHYLGAGHHHADAGMFHFSALGVDWFTESVLSQNYDGKVHNQVLVDGRSEAENMPGIANGYQAAGRYLGMQQGSGGTCGSADLTQSYTYRWLTQPPQVWTQAAEGMNWEMDPSAPIAKIYAGTARYKMRPWWYGQNFCNYIPTSRALFNPMQYVYRSVALMRGDHPYGVVIDDLKKDESKHLYQWTAMLNGGVWQAEYPGLPANHFVLGFNGQETKNVKYEKPLIPRQGAPLLLVAALGMKMSGNDQPLIQVECVEGPFGRNGVPAAYNRISVNQLTDEVRYRILLVPFRMGEPLPQVDSSSIAWSGQRDEFEFAAGKDQRTGFEVKRNGKVVLDVR